jgi:hypothetical protein
MAGSNLIEQEIQTFCTSVRTADSFQKPYKHLLLKNCFSDEVLTALDALDFPATQTEGLSGKREYHNDQRHYFSVANRAKEPAIETLAQVFRSQTVLKQLHDATGAVLDGTYVRIEYAQDSDGFWLEPHTDLGVKTITIIISIRDGQEHLGTDIYEAPDKLAHSCDFSKGAGLIFVPGENTWHGFEPRKINGIRKSIIMRAISSRLKSLSASSRKVGIGRIALADHSGRCWPVKRKLRIIPAQACIKARTIEPVDLIHHIAIGFER